MSDYRFLLFDSDHTLLDFDTDFTIALEKMYKTLGYDEVAPYSESILRSYERCNNRWWAKLERGECSKDELFINRFHDFFDELSITGDAQMANMLYFEELAHTGTPLAGALEMMKVLHSMDKFDIHIITNGNALSAFPRLENAGFAPYIGECFVSENVGAAKPMKEYFDYVFSSLDSFSPENVLVIGDSLSSDIAGANNAGVDSIWFNPDKKENSQAVPFTLEAQSYDDILNFLSDK